MKIILSFLVALLFWTSNAQDSSQNIEKVSQSTASKQVTTFTIESPQLKTSKKIWVYLPKNYVDNPKKKYPVIYMHDGQNLFDAKTRSRNAAGQLCYIDFYNVLWLLEWEFLLDFY